MHIHTAIKATPFQNKSNTSVLHIALHFMFSFTADLTHKLSDLKETCSFLQLSRAAQFILTLLVSTSMTRFYFLNVAVCYSNNATLLPQHTWSTTPKDVKGFQIFMCGILLLRDKFPLSRLSRVTRGWCRDDGCLTVDSRQCNFCASACLKPRPKWH